MFATAVGFVACGSDDGSMNNTDPDAGINPNADGGFGIS